MVKAYHGGSLPKISTGSEWTVAGFVSIALVGRRPREQSLCPGRVRGWWYAICKYHKEYRVPLRKTAIAVPDDLLAAVDRAAEERHESRNQFVNRVLRHAVRARRDADISRRLNELFAEREIADQQRQEAVELDATGTDWSDERW